jgi:hypothetical protein
LIVAPAQFAGQDPLMNLAFGVTYVQVWYIIWPIVFVLLLPGRRAFFVGLLLAYAAIIVELVHAYLWPWGAYANADAFIIVNSVVYLVLSTPTLFYLLGIQLTQFFSTNVFTRYFRTRYITSKNLPTTG